MQIIVHCPLTPITMSMPKNTGIFHPAVCFFNGQKVVNHLDALQGIEYEQSRFSNNHHVQGLIHRIWEILPLRSKRSTNIA
jgi:hypothetical protein